MSEALLENYENAKTLTHPGGHFVPASGAQKIVYNLFLEDQYKTCVK